MRKRQRVRPYRKKPAPQLSRMRIGGFPKTAVARLKYVVEESVNAGASGVPTVVKYHANGCFDPEVAVGGHQPIGFDEFMARYDHYYVLGSKIKLTPTTSSTSVKGPVVIAIRLEDSTAITPNSVAHVLENPGTVWTTWGPNPQGQESRSKYITKYYSCKKFFGYKPFGNKMQVGSGAANPEEDALFNVYVMGIDFSDPATITYIAEIEYIVAFSEPKAFLQS